MVLNFLVSAQSLAQLARLRPSSLVKIPAVGRKYASVIEQWQKRAHFSEEVKWVSEMIQEDAQRCLELDEKIKEVAKDSENRQALIVYSWVRNDLHC